MLQNFITFFTVSNHAIQHEISLLILSKLNLHRELQDVCMHKFRMLSKAITSTLTWCWATSLSHSPAACLRLRISSVFTCVMVNATASRTKRKIVLMLLLLGTWHLLGCKFMAFSREAVMVQVGPVCAHTTCCEERPVLLQVPSWLTVHLSA